MEINFHGAAGLLSFFFPSKPRRVNISLSWKRQTRFKRYRNSRGSSILDTRAWYSGIYPGHGQNLLPSCTSLLPPIPASLLLPIPPEVSPSRYNNRPVVLFFHSPSILIYNPRFADSFDEKRKKEKKRKRGKQNREREPIFMEKGKRKISL